jgi:hypothetical protein
MTVKGRRILYGWSYGKTGTNVLCPHLEDTVEGARKHAEDRYVSRDREKYPNAAPQRLEWREHTSPRGFGFGNRFWALYAERRYKRATFNNAHAGDMFRTEYLVNEMWIEEEEDA